MSTDHTVLTHPPEALSEVEIQDFIAMVRAGGEVGETVLEENIRKAECLAVARRALCLVGVAALKNPN